MTEIMPVPRNLSFTVLPAGGLWAAVFTFRTLLSAFPVLRGDEAEDRGHQQDRHGDAARDARGLKSFVHRGLHIAAQAEAHRVVNARARHQRQERDDEVRRDGVFARARHKLRIQRRDDGGEEIHAVNAHAQITAEQVRHPCEHAAERAENAAPVVHIEEDEKARTGDEDHHGLCPGGIAR